MQFYGEDALNDIDDQQHINPAAFFTDDVESNTQLLLELYGKEKSYEEYRKTGVHRFQLDIPENTEELKLVAYYKVWDLNLYLIETLYLISTWFNNLGVVHKLRWQDFGFFWPPTPLGWHFLWYERWQKVDIFGSTTYLVL